MIKLLSSYICNDCEEDFYLKPKKEVKCDCGSTDLSFEGMHFIESFPMKMSDGTDGFLSEFWMESAGIPVCHFCMNRDFDSSDPIEEGWLVKDKEEEEPFIYACACSSCAEKYSFEVVTREQLREETDGLFEEAEEIAEEHYLMLQAQIDNDRLNRGEEYVLKEYYGYSDEDFHDEDEDDDDEYGGSDWY